MIKKNTGHLSPPKGEAPVAIPESNDFVSRASIIAIIAKRIRLPGDTMTQAKDKVGQRLAYAIKKGNLQPPVKGQFVFGIVIRWARQQKGWGEPLKGLPETPLVTPTHELGKVRNAHLAEYAVTSKDSEALLNEAYERINKLEGQAGVLHAEVDLLRPIAKRRAEIAEKNRKSGRMGGRPRGGSK